MSTPDPEGMSMAAKVVGAITAVVAPIWGAYKVIDGKIDKKADKEEVANCLRHIEEQYKNAEKDRETTRDLCTDLSDKLQARIDENHRQVVGLIIGNRNAP